MTSTEIAIALIIGIALLFLSEWMTRRDSK